MALLALLKPDFLKSVDFLHKHRYCRCSEVVFSFSFLTAVTNCILNLEQEQNPLKSNKEDKTFFQLLSGKEKKSKTILQTARRGNLFSCFPSMKIN